MRQRCRSIALLGILVVWLTRWLPLELLLPASLTERRDNKCTSKQMPFFHNNMTQGDNGAVILFYHIAKTGGTTIRRAFANVSHVRYVLAKKNVPHRQVDAFLKVQQNNKHNGITRRKVLFLEFHGISPGLSELSERIISWRSQCTEKNIRFFAFTLLRDPVALHISAFTFFRHDDNKAMARNTSSSFALLQDQLLQTALPNRQCGVLHHGQGNKLSPSLSAVTSAQCDNVRQHLCREWDWVGTTEQLNTSTLPALHSIVHGTSAEVATVSSINIASANVQNWTVTVSQDTRQRLQNLSILDWELYKFFQKVTEQ